MVVSDTVRVVNTSWSLEATKMAPVGANQFALQIEAGPSGHPEALVLSVGYAGPPIITDPSQEEQALSEGIQVTPLGRYVLSRERTAQLIDMLQRALGAWDASLGHSPLPGGVTVGEVHVVDMTADQEVKKA
jgi:hypothetical protein